MAQNPKNPPKKSAAPGGFEEAPQAPLSGAPLSGNVSDWVKQLEAEAETSAFESQREIASKAGKHRKKVEIAASKAAADAEEKSAEGRKPERASELTQGPRGSEGAARRQYERKNFQRQDRTRHFHGRQPRPEDARRRRAQPGRRSRRCTRGCRQADDGLRRHRHGRGARQADRERQPAVQGRQALDPAPPCPAGQVGRRHIAEDGDRLPALRRPADGDCRSGRRPLFGRAQPGAARRHRLR
ncbi:hypothetical protein ABIA16_002208 [Sinorhizobium fredii]